MDGGRKRVVAIIAGILAAPHFKTPDDLFGTPNGSPRSDRMITAAVQWAERIMSKLDGLEERPEGMHAKNITIGQLPR
jgi:hypothetical protein